MFRSLRLLEALVKKDLKVFITDRRAAVLCFAVPIMLASAFSLIFDRPAQIQSHPRLPLIVVVEDESSFTQAIVADLCRSDRVEVEFADRASARREIDRRANGVVLILPVGFGAAGSRATPVRKPTVEIMHHPLSGPQAGWAEGVLTEIVMRRIAREWLQAFGVNESPEARCPFSTVREMLTVAPGHPFNSRSHSFCGMTIQYMLFWGMECGLMLLRERRRGIWDRTLVAPVSATMVLIARAFSTALIALLQIAATFGFGYAVFGVCITGSLGGFCLLAATISFLAAAIGLLVASIGRTEAGARSVLIVVVLGISMLGGLWLPAFLLPRWAQDWSQFLPTTWAMRGLDGVTWQGLSLGEVLPCVAAVNLFALAFLSAAVIRLYWSDRRQRQGGCFA